MSDERRALGFLERCPSDPFNVGADEAVRLLIAEFAAVRADECQRIRAYLLEHCASLAWRLSPQQVVQRLERGEHAGEATA